MTTENKRDLAADLAICEAATAGPWFHCGSHIAIMPNVSGGYPPNDASIAETCDGEYIENYNQADAVFIAEAREGWPEAIRRAIAAEAAVEELRREIARLQAQIDYVKYTCGELAETYRIYAEEGADRGSSLERVYSGMSIAYEDAVDMFEPEVPANE